MPKTNAKYILCLVLFLWCFGAFAQQQKEAEERQFLWLYNSKGKVVGQQDSTVEKSFFKANEVFVQSSVPWKKGDKYVIIIHSSTGDNRAIYLTMPVISFEIKEMIVNDTGQMELSVAKALEGGEYQRFRLIVK